MEPFGYPDFVLLYVPGDVSCSKARADNPPSDFSQRALKEDVIHCFTPKAEITSGIPYPMSAYQVSLVRIALFSTSHMKILIL